MFQLHNNIQHQEMQEQDNQWEHKHHLNFLKK